MFRKEGCSPWEYRTPFLKQVRKGLRKTLPSPRDVRSAFILPKYVCSRPFNLLSTEMSCFLRFGTIVGFIGMLRPHTFRQLQPDSFTLVVKDNFSPAFSRIIRPMDLGTLREALHLNQRRYKPIGFCIKFKSKTQLNATAYFPNISDPTTHYNSMCPVDALRGLVVKGFFTKSKFRKAFGKSAVLKSYVKSLTNDDLVLSPHALRIGGRTWYITQGMDRQFVDFLGTWVSPEASARYYRESPAAVLRMLQNFYCNLPHPRELY